MEDDSGCTDAVPFEMGVRTPHREALRSEREPKVCRLRQRARAANTVLMVLALTIFTPRASFTLAQAHSSEHVRVLLLHPDDLHTRQVIEADQATRAALTAALTSRPEFHSEGFENLRLSGTLLQEPAFIEELIEKYSSHPPDLVITHGEMFKVILRHRDELWPTVPLMFVDVAEQRVLNGELPRDIPRVSVDVDFGGTFQLARRLQPDAHRVLIVFGAAEHDRYWGRYVMKILEPYRKEMEIQVTEQDTVDETIQALSTRDLDTIVLYVSVLRDRTGHSYTTADVAQRAAAVSKAPVYSPYGSLLGLGLVGGFVTQANSSKAQAVGDVAKRLLSGESPSSIPQSYVIPPVCSVDSRALQHWRLNTAGLTPGCRVLFREPSFLVAHRTEAIAIAGAAVVLTFMLLAVLRQSFGRWKAEQAVEQQRVELAHVGRLASAGRLTASITHEINQSLTAILSNAEAASILLTQENPPLAEIKHILEDIGADDIRAAEVIRRLRSLLTKQATERQAIAFHDIVHETLKLLEPLMKARQIAAVLDLTFPPPVVEGDRVQLQQVLLNFLLNAIEACGEVSDERRRVEIFTNVDTVDNLHVAVSDLGCGFPPERSQSLFDPFVSSKRTGMGLGLFLVRAIVEAHGGQASGHNNAVGSTFSFTIPCKQSSRGNAAFQVEAG